MPARMYYDNDADPAALAGQTVAVIGYGSQGHAHALNLKESGVDVVVGLAPGSKSRAIAQQLYLSERTIENHLQNVYTKLGVKARSELATALGINPA